MTIVPSLWKRLNVLVPEPICRTFGDDYDVIVWSDARAKPTVSALNAVTDQQIIDAENEAFATAMKSNKDIFRAVGDVTYDFIKNPNLYSTRAQYLNACKNRLLQILGGT